MNSHESSTAVGSKNYANKDKAEKMTQSPEIDDAKNSVLLPLERYDCNRTGDKINEALSDALKIISLDDKNIVAYRDALDCYIRKGEIFEADEIIAKAKISHEDEIFCDLQIKRLERLKSFREDISDSLTAKFINKCLLTCYAALSIAPHSDEFKFIKMRCLVIQKRFSDAEHMNEMIGDDMTGALNGMCFIALKLYYASYVDESLEILRKILEVVNKSIKAVEDLRHKILRFKDLFQAGKNPEDNFDFSQIKQFNFSYEDYGETD